MPPNWHHLTTAAQKSAALCKTSSSTSENQLDIFSTALVDLFAQKALTGCSGERRETVVTPRGVSTYSS
jgi:hypothetical protein